MLCSSSHSLVPVAWIVVLSVRQKGPNVNMALCDSAVFFARIVDDGNQSISVVANVEDDITVDIISILEYLQDFVEVSPTSIFSDSVPRMNLIGRVRILITRFSQVPFCDNVHGGNVGEGGAIRATLYRFFSF